MNVSRDISNDIPINTHSIINSQLVYLHHFAKLRFAAIAASHENVA
jgi:hypothetical protein